MSSYHGGGVEEWLRDSLPVEVSGGRMHLALEALGPCARQVADRLEDYDEREWSWRDYRNSLWDLVPAGAHDRLEAALRAYTTDELRRDADGRELETATTALRERVMTEILEVVRDRGLRGAVARVSELGVSERAAIAVVAEAMARPDLTLESAGRFWRGIARAAQGALVSVGRRGQDLLDAIAERALPGEVDPQSLDTIADAVVVFRRLLRERDSEHGRALDLREVEEILECGEGEAPVRLRALVGDLAEVTRERDALREAAAREESSWRNAEYLAGMVRRAHREGEALRKEMLARVGDARSEVALLRAELVAAGHVGIPGRVPLPLREARDRDSDCPWCFHGVPHTIDAHVREILFQELRGAEAPLALHEAILDVSDLLSEAQAGGGG